MTASAGEARASAPFAFVFRPFATIDVELRPSLSLRGGGGAVTVLQFNALRARPRRAFMALILQPHSFRRPGVRIDFLVVPACSA
jgi:hypothetical protein